MAVSTDAGQRRLDGLFVLVVEDSADAGEMLCQILGAWGARCRWAADGPSALHAVAEERPDAVLLDIGLPEVDGWEVGRRLRATPAGSDLPIAALTAFGTSEDLDRSRAAGFDAHFVKPVTAEILHRWLGTLRPAPAGTPDEHQVART
jgi:CheY-like chemotaxis protein